jgi:hypothetical protein
MRWKGFESENSICYPYDHRSIKDYFVLYSVVVFRLGSAPVQRLIVTSGSFVTCMGHGSDQGFGHDLPRSVVPPAP